MLVILARRRTMAIEAPTASSNRITVRGRSANPSTSRSIVRQNPFANGKSQRLGARSGRAR